MAGPKKNKNKKSSSEHYQNQRAGGGLRRSKTPYQSVCMDGGEIETVQTCKYLGVVLDNKLEWSANIEAVSGGARAVSSGRSGPSMFVVI